MVWIAMMACSMDVVEPSTAVADIGYEVGQRVPDLPLADQDGNPVALRDLDGDPLLIELKALWRSRSAESEGPGLEAEYGEQGLRYVPLVVEGVGLEPAVQSDAASLAKVAGLEQVLWDPEGNAADLGYDGMFPSFALLDVDGVVTARTPVIQNLPPLIDLYYLE